MHTRRTLIIRKPDLNNFERYKIDNKSVIQNLRDTPAFHKFVSENPLPYYIGEPRAHSAPGKGLRPEPHIAGGNFLSDFISGFKKGFTTTLDIGSKVLPLIGLGEAEDGSEASFKGCSAPEEGCGKRKTGRKKKVVKEESSSEEEELAHEKKENKKLKKIKKVVQEMQEENKKMMKGKGLKVARGELVRKLMKEKGMTLGQASRHIKENNLLKK
jgi:hypothetical protein